MNKLFILGAGLLMAATSAVAQRLEPPKVEIFGFEVVAHDQHGHADAHHHKHDKHHSHDHDNDHGHGHDHSHSDDHDGHDGHHKRDHDNHHAHTADIPGFRIGVFVRNPNDININPTAINYRITFENKTTISGSKHISEPIQGLARAEYDFVFVPSDQRMVEDLKALMAHQTDDVDYNLDVSVEFVGYRRDYTAKDSGEVDLDDYR